MNKKKKPYTIIEKMEEFYPETGLKLIRPKVHIVSAVFILMGVFAFVGTASLGLLNLFSLFAWYKAIEMPWGLQFALLYVLGLLLCVIVFAKHIVIFTIRLYQKFGPYEVRCRCLFIPNCSEYMILAIKKYGLFKGVKKGIDRFKRCHDPNGGEDYP